MKVKLLFVYPNLLFIESRSKYLFFINILVELLDHGFIILKKSMQTGISTVEKMHNDKGLKSKSHFTLFNLFTRDHENHDGVPRINIYLLRLLFILMFIFLDYDAWSYIFHHTGKWDNANAAAFCMWGSYSAISFIGIIRPLKMLPIVLFEIVYKTAWLLVVSYPLWIKHELIGSPAEGMTRVFIWVVFPIVAMPWRYFYRVYIRGKKTV